MLASNAALIACSSKPVVPVEKPIAQFSSQIRINDKVQNKEHVLSAQLKTFELSLRADLTATLGVYVGSIVIQPQKLKMLLARERKFYETNNVHVSLQKFIGVDVKPSWLAAFIRDESPGKEFSCTFTFDQKPMHCVSTKEDLVMNWLLREDTQRVIVVKSPQFDLQISITDKQPKVQDPSEVFRLEAPKGYQVLPL